MQRESQKPEASEDEKGPKRVSLTPERISDFTCPEGAKQAFLWDEKMPRLAVRATAGAKSFIFERKLDRRTIRLTIGSVKVWELEDVTDKKTKAVTKRGARAEARREGSRAGRALRPARIPTRSTLRLWPGSPPGRAALSCETLRYTISHD